MLDEKPRNSILFPNSGFYFFGLLLLALAGFWRSYFSKIFDDTSLYTHIHASSMMLWLAMLITQPFLIRFHKHRLHKLIGKSSYVLFPVLVISLILLAHSQIEIREQGIPGFRLYVLFLQLSLLLLFVFSYSLAIVYRRNPARHARYMIVTALTLIDPAVARIPLGLPALPFDYQVLTFGLTDLVLIVLIFGERKRKQGREVFPTMLALFIFFQWLNLTWTNSDAWAAFSIWFARLPLT